MRHTLSTLNRDADNNLACILQDLPGVSPQQADKQNELRQSSPTLPYVVKEFLEVLFVVDVKSRDSYQMVGLRG